MAFVYIVEEGGKKQTFEGFKRASPEHGNLTSLPKGANFLALVVEEDILCPWWLEDDSSAVEELQRYYRMTWGREMPALLFVRYVRS